ncbi:prolyl endopeptidase [Octopus bimaculoides]|uniref:Prolyl endopeptidase n=1 Tax=Octopus bimaculoides TaxID=37653 RepID=A0A0L8G0N4_OCTBM|nr:prolyl endopeptidase [Octopus bimaculoides]|eukprot:XP_014785500.1 PREDICTED: prolyl endopeptidase-like [Octopus bimaculoides]
MRTPLDYLNCIVFIFLCHLQPTCRYDMEFSYPKARRDESVIDDYHGHKVADPYRWLEDPDAEETIAFVDAQNSISHPFIEQCPHRQKIQESLTEKWNFAKYSSPAEHGGSYYYYCNSGLQNQSVLYVQDDLKSEPCVFLDPNSLSEDGTLSISGTAFSEDGSYFAYGLSKCGSDWITIQFKKAPSGEDLPDTLKHVKFSSMAWTHDNKGMFYNRYPVEGKSDGTETTTNLYNKLYYHRLGTDQDEDLLTVQFQNEPKWKIGAEVSVDGKYLLLSPNEGCDPVNRLFYVELDKLPNGITENLPYVKLIDNFDAQYEYITNEGSVFTFLTNLNAPKYKIINIDFQNPDPKNWKTLVEEDKNAVLEWASCVNHNKLVLCYLKDVKNKLYVHRLETGLLEAEIPLDIGTIIGCSGRKKSEEIFIHFMSFLTPGIIYRVDMTVEKPTPEVFRTIKVNNFDFSQFEVQQVFYPSKDGTQIPMFLVHKKGLVRNGNTPTFLYGYGGFDISMKPTFSVSRLVFLKDLDGVYALANIRGGGEYGEKWHKSGTHAKKQNVFDDFHAAAEYLINQKYTCPKKLVIHGQSNGGLLVAACINQRPELYGVALAQVGVMDMFRFHKFTIGHAWTTDFGCSDISEQFEFLKKYSPLHNIRVPKDDIQYPSTLLLTADHDDRVVPLHSLKFIAELQHTMTGIKKQSNPLLIKIDTKAGHGRGKPTAMIIQEQTDMYCFIVKSLGLDWFDH